MKSLTNSLLLTKKTYCSGVGKFLREFVIMFLIKCAYGVFSTLIDNFARRRILESLTGSCYFFVVNLVEHLVLSNEQSVSVNLVIVASGKFRDFVVYRLISDVYSWTKGFAA